MSQAEKTSVEISIDAATYEQLLNNVEFIAPLEIGVEVAVYMLLFGLIDRGKYSLLDVNTMAKRKGYIFASGKSDDSINANLSNSEDRPEIDKVPDLVIVNKSFEYNRGKVNENNKHGAYGFVEVKGLSVKFDEAELKVQENNTPIFIWTNGCRWILFKNKKQEWDIDLENKEEKDERKHIFESKFKELIENLSHINWEN